MELLKILIFICLSFMSLSVGAQSIIANPNVDVDSLSQSKARSIFLMRTTEWNNGIPIIVVALESSDPLHIDFCKNILGLFPYQLQQIWDRIIFTGTGQSPRYARSIDEIKKLVSLTPGAVGYIDREDIDETVRLIYVED